MKPLPIYTQTTDCRDCYKCIRECPLKAIKVTDHKASLVQERCMFCGHCVTICPAKAKKIRSDVAIARHLIKQGKRVYVSLAPSYLGEFSEFSTPQLIDAFKKLGFEGVSETALGAQLVSQQTKQYLNGRSEGVYISSACPSVVELIRKYYPQHTLAITPFMSPLLTHAKLLKHWDADASVVFVGPCIAKKTEADEFPNLLDAALTFTDIKEWMADEGIAPAASAKGHAFYPAQASDGILYPIDGGMLNSIRQHGNVAGVTFMSFSGMKQVSDVLQNLDELGQGRPVFLELLACDGGCINGPGTSQQGNSAKKRLQIIHQFQKQKSSGENLPSVRIERDFFAIKPIDERVFTETEIREALSNIGKNLPIDELNCSGCGYDTCRDFAKATLSGLAEPAMCVSFMRKVAHNQATILLQKIPSGVVVVDAQMKVVEMNQSCARILGPDTEALYEMVPGLTGAHVDKLGDIAEHFKTALHTGKEFKELPIRENGLNYQLSIFHIQKHKLVTGIIQALNQPQFNMDIVEKRTREVIHKNMETVQKIAILLGENASFTDSLLNSIVREGIEQKAVQ